MPLSRIKSASITDGTIVATDLANGAVSNTKIASGAVEQSLTDNSFALGMRNRIINGGMMIDQRNAGNSVTINSDQYTLDRWKAFQTASGKFSVQRNAGSVTPPAGFGNYLGVTSLSSYSVSSGDYFLINQPIEGLNVVDLNFGNANARPVVISFWVRSSLTGTFGGGLINAGFARTYPFTYTISSANTWEYKTVSFSGDTTGTWETGNGNGMQLRFVLGCGSARLAPTPNAWNAGGYDGPTGSTSVVGTNGATWYITGVQLESGTVATPFERRPYGMELQLCQRYYETSYPEGTRVGAAATPAFIHRNYASSSNLLIGSSWFKVTKRTTPTVQNYDGSGNAGKVGINDNITDPENQASFTTNVTPHGMAVGTNGYNCNGFRYNYTADAEL